jgi:hypothetical protein
LIRSQANKQTAEAQRRDAGGADGRRGGNRGFPAELQKWAKVIAGAGIKPQ